MIPITTFGTVPFIVNAIKGFKEGIKSVKKCTTQDDISGEKYFSTYEFKQDVIKAVFGNQNV